MENVTYTEDNQRKIEKFILIIYSIYSLGMMIIFAGQEGGGWVDFFLLLALMVGWMINISKYGTYSRRAGITAYMMQVSVVLYAVQVSDLTRTLPFFAAFIIFLGLYGLPEIISAAIISSLVIFGYHGLVLGTFFYGSMEEILWLFLQLGNMLLMEYVMYVWTKRNNEGSSQLLDAIMELKAAESSKNDFLANVSHEIRTPINSICGMSEIILREDLSDPVRENVQDIQLAGRNLMAVVSDILDFSQLQSGRIELEEEAYNITSTINDVINMVMARKSEKRIELIVDCDANLPCALLGDEKKLRRIITNLVDNAIKFTDEGYVMISVGCRKETYGINLIVTVQDTGIGMDEEGLEKMFTSFNQVDASRRRHEGGIGLGLAISNVLVQKMGGAITVKSKPGKGSRIRCVIPQKVLDKKPIVSIRNKEHVNVMIYIDMEQFNMTAIRDEYSRTMTHMTEQLKGKSHICRNFAELQRRAAREKFSHIFISIAEYRVEREYYDELSARTKVVVVLERENEKEITNPAIMKIYKPFYVLAVAAVLNAQEDAANKSPGQAGFGIQVNSSGKFVTKDVKVLAVDDNRTNLRVIQGLLSHYNIKVATAMSGEEALEKIESADYDFVFMDHMMPEMDGVEALHRIRHKVGSYFQKVPVIALTANAVAGAREMLMEEGFNDFLEKPVERSVLERVLRRNLPAEKLILQREGTPEAEKQMSGKQMPSLPQPEQAVAGEPQTKPEKQEPQSWADLPEIEGLDIQRGMLYCNGREPYLEVLRGFCEDYSDMGERAREAYEQQDWKNYTITVHGMKSAMRTIGALELSALAAELEAAGKEGRTEVISEHHGELMKEYEALFLRLREHPVLFPQRQQAEGGQTQEQEKAAKEQQQELAKAESEAQQALTETEFEQLTARLEDAAYSLDRAMLEELLEQLRQYQYAGEPLEKIVKQAKRKVEMSDYISAAELIIRWKNKMMGRER